MQVRDAFVRAVRTAGAAFAAALVVVKPAADLIGVEQQAMAQASAVLAALIFGVTTGLVTFGVCLAEDNTKFQLPK